MLSQVTDRRGWRSSIMLALSLSALLSFQRPSSAEDQNMSVIAHASSGPLACEIRKVRMGASVQLSGVVSSSAAVTGSFRFVLKKSGPSGNSNVNQGNSFDLVAGAEAHVGHMTINLQPDDEAVVDLLATSSDGIACHATATLAIEL